jgi:succinoglycan biosynthesis transport protein ExoP
MNTRLLTPEDYLRVIIQRKWLIAVTVVVSLALAGAVCVWLPKSYRSTTTLFVEGQKIPETYVKGVDYTSVSQPQDQVAIARQFITTRKLLSQVAAELNLYGYENEKPDSAKSESAVKTMRNDLNIGMSKSQGFLTISFAHESPLIARDVTARLASLFIEEKNKNRGELAEGASEFLTNELIAAKAELEAKEKAIALFKQEHMGELPQQMEANLRTLDRLQAEMTAQSETENNLNTRLASIDKALQEYEESDTLASVPRRRGDPRLARLKELERSLFALSAKYKGNYPDIVEIRQEIKRLKEMSTEEYIAMLQDLHEESAGTKTVDPYHRELLTQRERLRAELAAGKGHQNRIAADMRQYQARVDRTPVHETKLTTLMRDYENMQKNYQSLLDKKLSAGLAGNLEKRRKGEEFSIVDRANLPVVPEKPNVLYVMLAGLAIGCALGAGSAVALEFLGRGFRYPEEAELVLGLPLLASIPLYQSAFGVQAKSLPDQTGGPALISSERHGRQLPSQRQSRTGNGRLRRHPDATRGFSPGANLVSMWRPRSSVAEQFRVAATRLELMGGGRKNTVIVVTSALMGEGKSSTAINLAYVLAKDLEKSTILIDCDLKRPMQHVYAGVGLEPGLTEVLYGDKPVGDCLQRLGELSLWTLPAGSFQNRSLELSKIQRLRALLTELRPRFDYIIVDAPPILPLADMNVLASMGDVLVLVVRAGATGQAVVQKALRTLRDTSEARIILNGIANEATPYYMEQKYYLGTDVDERV